MSAETHTENRDVVGIPVLMMMTSAINGETSLGKSCMILMTRGDIAAVAVTMGSGLRGAEGTTVTMMIIDLG